MAAAAAEATSVVDVAAVPTEVAARARWRAAAARAAAEAGKSTL